MHTFSLHALQNLDAETHRVNGICNAVRKTSYKKISMGSALVNKLHVEIRPANWIHLKEVPSSTFGMPRNKGTVLVLWGGGVGYKSWRLRYKGALPHLLSFELNCSPPPPLFLLSDAHLQTPFSRAKARRGGGKPTRFLAHQQRTKPDVLFELLNEVFCCCLFRVCMKSALIYNISLRFCKK